MGHQVGQSVVWRRTEAPADALLNHGAQQALGQSFEVLGLGVILELYRGCIGGGRAYMGVI